MPSEQRPSLARLRGHVLETGQAVQIDAPRRRRRVKGWRDYVNLVDIGVMTQLELTGMEYRVLFALLRFIPEKGGNESRVHLAEVAEIARTHRPAVSRIMRQFRDRNIVRTERQGVHEVNPWIAYSGDFDSWNAAAEKWPEPVWVKADSETGEVS